MESSSINLSSLLNNTAYAEEAVALALVKRGMDPYMSRTRNETFSVDVTVQLRCVCAEMYIAYAIRLLRTLSYMEKNPLIIKIEALRQFLENETYGMEIIDRYVVSTPSKQLNQMVNQIKNFWKMDNQLLKEMVTAVLYTIESEAEEPQFVLPQ